MKNFIAVSMCFFVLYLKAQTAAELIGKWKLVKWTQGGTVMHIETYYKTDQVYQVFKENKEFEGIVGNKIRKGKWSLSQNNDKLTIKAGLSSITFNIDFFDANKRIVSEKDLGTLEYEKMQE